MGASMVSTLTSTQNRSVLLALVSQHFDTQILELGVEEGVALMNYERREVEMLRGNIGEILTLDHLKALSSSYPITLSYLKPLKGNTFIPYPESTCPAVPRSHFVVASYVLLHSTLHALALRRESIQVILNV